MATDPRFHSSVGSDVAFSDTSETSELRKTPPAYYIEKKPEERKIEHCVVTLPLYMEPEIPKPIHKLLFDDENESSIENNNNILGGGKKKIKRVDDSYYNNNELMRENDLRDLTICRNEDTLADDRRKLKLRQKRRSIFGTLNASVIDIQNQYKIPFPNFHKEIFWLAAHLPFSTSENDLENIVEYMKENVIESWIKKQRYKINKIRRSDPRRNRGKNQSHEEYERNNINNEIGNKNTNNMYTLRGEYRKQNSAPSILNQNWRKSIQYIVSLYICMPKDPTSYLYGQIIHAIGKFQTNKRNIFGNPKILFPNEALTLYIHLVHCPDDLGNIALVRRNLVIISTDPDSFGAAGSGISLMRAVPRPSIELRRMYSLSILSSDELQLDFGNKIFDILYRILAKRIHKIINEGRNKKGRKEKGEEKKTENKLLQSICIFLCYISLGPDKIVSLEGHTGVDGYMHLLIRRISVMYELSGNSIYKYFPIEVLLAGLWRCGSSRCVDCYVTKMELLINSFEIAIGMKSSPILRRLREIFRIGESSPHFEIRGKDEEEILRDLGTSMEEEGAKSPEESERMEDVGAHRKERETKIGSEIRHEAIGVGRM